MLVCATAIIVMGVVLLYVVGRCLRPVQLLAGDIGSLGETELSRRIRADAVPTELAPVVDKLNGFLGRLEQAFVREKAFTADVSHELRTPLAGLRSTLEVCRSRPREAAAYESALDDCRGITDRMEAMVQSLLLLARSDSGQIVVDRRPVDIGRLVSDCWGAYQYRAERQGVEVTMDLRPECIAATDPDTLRIVLNNLLDNAVSYVNEKGQLSIATRAEHSAAMIEIANSGSRIAAEDATRLFDRFWRGDAARTEAGLNCGLGLSISKRLVTLLGGEIQIRSAADGKFVVSLKLPGK
jgi:signal transduction histidine kinase